MPWLKKNLWLVVGGVVALGLLGVAGYYLFRNYTAESQVTDQLNQQTKDLDDLAKLNPHPGNEKINNIEEAKKQEKQLEAFLKEAQKRFVPLNYPSNLDGGQFKLLLDATVDELQRRAEKTSVKLPAQYAFTFAAQKPLMSFEQNTIAPMVRVLTDIRAISDVLFDAKVLTLDGVRRMSVAMMETPSSTPGGSSDFWTKKAFTNDLAVLTPYEFTFHCFTGELAAVLEKLYSSPHCFIVKNLVVDPTASQLMDKNATPDATSTMPGMPYMMNYQQLQMMMRYSMFRRPITPPPETPTLAPARPGLTTVLDEKPFRVIMWVDVVCLRDLAEAKASRAKPARPQPPPAAPGGEAAPETASITNAPPAP